MPKRKQQHETVSATDAARHFGDWANHVQYGGKRILVTRRGKPICAIVNVDDLELLETLDEAA